jgi:valyl-tRNA synthetase
MTDLPENYDPERAESTWRAEWQEMDVYEYTDTGATDYIIDTPPPYPTGDLHLGHGLQWSYIDFAARYRRLQGDDVCFPQGWDCHGLPTEVKVEENHDIHRTDVAREEFRRLCIEHTEERIDEMKATMRQLGFGIDWSAEYRTMDQEYWAKTQRSFVEMTGPDGDATDPSAGYVYRDEHPVNWCPRCETAIADAEVETEEGVGGTLYTIRFPDVEGEAIDIATTRPELLAACVAIAVDPDDERYADRVGETFEVPLFGQTVDLIADEDVDSDFGTGAVMVCTFGDKQDVDWWATHDLALRPVVTEQGTLTDLAGEFAGLALEEASAEIAEALDDEEYLLGTEPTEQSIGHCWRCDTPIEILSKEQWFVEVRADEIVEWAQAVEWIPEHMYERLEAWTEGMAWDWVISRQRVFATPIPAWECGDCGEWHVAAVEELPVDPTETDPAVEVCPNCEGEDWHGETDVMDTWMDSSITPLHISGWPDDLGAEAFDPVALRPQGHDIIRTWAFYTLLRTGALTDEKPWERILVNGMVFGPDGNKMSKSRGNVVTPEDAIEEYGADAVRQALALGGRPGSDVQYQPKEATSARRFQQKVWNITRFAAQHLDEEREPMADPAYRDIDRWLLAKCARVAESVAGHMDEYRYDDALRELREFVWHDLADDYIELCKGRLYSGRPGERDAARQALETALSASLGMLSPFAPFLTEEAWHALPTTEGSVHDSDWPTVDTASFDDEAETVGDLIADVAATVRGWKSDTGMALNEELDRVEVYPDDRPEGPVDTYDLSEAVGAPVRVEFGTPSVERVPVDIDPDYSVIGPAFRDQAGAVVAALEALDPAEGRRQVEREGQIKVDLGEDAAVVSGDAVEIREEYRGEEGEEVAVVEDETATLLIYP